MGDHTLDQIQRLLTDAIRAPSRPAPGAASPAESLLVPSPGGMDRGSRLEVYREQFWLRHVANLSDDFPTVRCVLGDAQLFHDLASAYLGAAPPRTWNLQRLGLDLPAFVATTSPWDSDTVLHDAALLDWAFMEAFDAPDTPPLDASVLATAAQEAWPMARISFHPSLRTVATGHPVHDLREAGRRSEHAPRPAPARTHTVVWRDAACFLRMAQIEAMASKLMVDLARGTPLGSACEALAAAHPEIDSASMGARVASWFQAWTANAWVRAVAF